LPGEVLPVAELPENLVDLLQVIGRDAPHADRVQRLAKHALKGLAADFHDPRPVRLAHQRAVHGVDDILPDPGVGRRLHSKGTDLLETPNP